ncbi:polyketide synthase, partial [Salmonella enterica]|nr:polyketide synthase [Salmonella enterica]EHM9592195.1 polyketide synthase [Salmonella enterica subsp. enterica serovar Java]EJC3484124.1 polyketide synthase [Salmonella enterica]EJZ6323135.1 polyketide synthase [Salmonella enterica]
MNSVENSLRQAAAVIQKLKNEVGELKYKETEPVAIIGLSARMPGANNLDELWRMLQNGESYFTHYQVEQNEITCGLMENMEYFDAGFFNISPREAKKMDVRQRILLEQAWEAIENAGLCFSENEKPSSVGVFVGASKGNAGRTAYAENIPDVWDITGSLDSFLAGRLSYILGVNGPSFTLDTACSSSLVAVHLAVRALRSSECEIALVGGIGLVPRDVQEVHSWLKLNHMSSTGSCKTFDAEADGIISSEGCGVVILKRLSDAERDGDRIWGVIRGSAINHDGRTQGLTVPSGTAQEAVVRAALRQAGVKPADVDYVECHGTGTRLGDPIEVQALGAVLGEGRSPDRPVILGSVKSNIG